MRKSMMVVGATLGVVAGSWSMNTLAQPESGGDENKDTPHVGEKVSSSTFGAIRARGLGPALMSGRISDFAFNPHNYAEYYVATASGGVWKTSNNGTTYSPIFDSQGSYSIGCVEIDPHNHNTVWVGSGENNSQRSVSFGDGVYKSTDGGRSWKNVGLKDSQHIGMIVVHPDDPDTVFVAAQGPLWNAGGDRGLYMTTDGGNTWSRILHISDDTGISEVHMDPRNPDTMYAVAYQRRRRVWTLIDGGPESGVYRSKDGGQTWHMINRGLPGGDRGRIGMDVSPVNPDVLYAIVTAKTGQGGFYRSTNRGESWQRMSSYGTSSPQYYNEIDCDPHNVDRVYLHDTYLQVTNDGGATWSSAQGSRRHVDNHALWIDPDNEKHLVVGCDGGVYESWDQASTWQYKANLPITQFYRVTADNSEPFYYIYGGTQDNNTLGGPSRTRDRSGISNEEWFVTVGGDGFETQVDPEDPNIVYSQWQYGGLVRYDRRSGENVDIKPQPKPGDPPTVFNWDAPLLISPHSNTRLYFGGRRLYRSDDRGNSWTPISNDLSRGLDRNELEVMGKVQPVDAVEKHLYTSIYGSLISLTESPLVEDLIYVGTDDGLVHVTDNAGETWRKIDAFPGVPHMTYVSSLMASRHDPDTVYAAFDNHKNGDFKPYVLVSRDRGQSWTSISGNLSGRDIVYSINEDHVNPELLFVGTEFGAYYTLNGGKKWIKIGGIPTISVRDVEIQRRENDLVFATFGRGFYIVDDYSPLQHVSVDALDEDAHVFPIKEALMYPSSSKGRGSQGNGYWTASNPPYGAVFTYHLKKSLKSAPKLDTSASKPDYETIRARDRHRSSALILTIRDDAGETVRRLRGSTSKGVHRTTWDLRYAGGGGFAGGPPVLPGTYTIQISKQEDGEVTDLTEPIEFGVRSLALGTFQPEDPEEVASFHREIGALYKAAQGATRALSEAESMVSGVEQAVFNTPGADLALAHEAHEITNRLKDIRIAMDGDRTPSRYGEPTSPSLRDRIRNAMASFRVTAPPTQTQRDAYDYAAADIGEVLDQLRMIVEEDIPALHERLDEAGVAWTAGRRVPDWD